MTEERTSGYTRRAGYVSLVLLVLGVLGPGTARAEERFALLIGANAGWANDRPLRYAESDADRLKQTLVELGGFEAERVEVLYEPNTALVRDRLKALGDTLRRLGRDSLVVFYYSGHADERHLHLRGPPLSFAELRQSLEALPATVRLGVLDACRSGSILTAKGERAPAAFSVEVTEELRARGLALLTSSGADELSQETQALAGSVFTHHLISGLLGVADTDGDGRVRLSEAWWHAYVRTRADTAPTAVPHQPAWLRALEGQGEPVLTWLERATSQVVVPKGNGERYVVTDALEVRLVAEARAEPDRPGVLALVPGRYRLKRVEDKRLTEAQVVLGPRQRVEAAGLSWVERPLSGGVLKGRPDAGDEAAMHAWRRSEAMRLLASGEPGAALSLFEALLKQQPGDVASARGKARALVRLAEAYERVGEQERQRDALREALRAEPELAEDPDLRVRHKELRQLRAALRGPLPEVVPERLLVLPRWGVGVELLGPRGMGAVVGSMLLDERWKIHAAVDVMGPGVDVGARFLLERATWSAFIGAGAHLSLPAMGGPAVGDVSLRLVDVYTYQQVWNRNLHTEVGLHYLSPSGFFLEFSVGSIFFLAPPEITKSRTVPILGLGAGWIFPS